MARPDQESINTFMSVTGVSEASAIRKLEEHQGNLNEAVNAYFNETFQGNIGQEPSFSALQDDNVEIDDPMPVESNRPQSSLPKITTSLFDGGAISSHTPFVSHPREVKDGAGATGQSGTAPATKDVPEAAHDHGPDIPRIVIVEDKDISNARIAELDGYGIQGSSVQSGPSVPTIVDVPDYSNDIEEEMIRAAIEASKQDAEMSTQQYSRLDLAGPTRHVQSHLEDAELARAVSLSLQTAEKGKALRELEENVVTPELETRKPSSPDEIWKLPSSHGRQPQLEIGSASIQDETDDAEELQLVTHRRRRVASTFTDTPKDDGGVQVNPPSSEISMVNIINFI